MKRWLPFVAVILVLSAAACGSDEAKIDEDEAEDIAAAALLAETHLPGNNWVETARDDFEDEDDFPETDACEDLNAFFEDLEDEGDEPLVMTNVTFEREPGADEPIPFEVESEIKVHEGTAGGGDLQEQGEAILEDANFDDCMEDFAEQAGEEVGGEGEYERHDPSVDAPDNGFALAFGIKLTVQGQEFEAVGELYMWTHEHVQSQVSFLGTPGQLDEDLIEDILDEAVDRVEAAQERD
jgi:hypothetical protein